jgi:GNAT superfamily N-acetyltransferase
MAVSIRPATVADAREIAEIQVNGWRATYRGRMPDPLLDSLSVDERAEQRRHWLAEPPGPDFRTWVAEDGSGIVGFANTGPTDEPEPGAAVGQLYAIYVDPTRIGTGVGRALLTHAVRNLVDNGFTAVVLWVLDTNARARRFYEVAGFAPDGGEQVETFGGVPLREVRYRRAL